MQALLWIFFVFLNSRPVSSHKVQKTLPLVDAVHSTLEKERWNDDQDCLQATLELLRGVQNNSLWAVSMWDSMQLPMGTFHGVRAHLGHFDQCLETPAPHPVIKQQYCVVEVRGKILGGRKEFGAFDDAHEFYKYPNKYNRYHNTQEVGVCLPAVCPPTSIAKIYHHIHSFTHLPDGEVVVNHQDCQTGSTEYSSKFYLFWCFICILVTTAVFSTYLNKHIDDGKSSCLSLITNSFCLRRNFNGLFESNKRELFSLNGVRCLAAFSMVLMHEGYYSLQTPLVNAQYLDEFSATNGGKFVKQTSVLVDTFFTVSGLLLMRNLLTSNTNLLVNLLKRYFRLIGPFALSILYINTALMDMGRGPYWPRANRDETDVCREYWWKSLLMLNNGSDTTCHLVTWHMASDFQLSVLVTCIYFIYKKNKTIGLSVFSVTGVAMSMYLGYDVYRKKLPYFAFETAVTVNIRKDTSILYHHFLTHCHSAPYFIGVIMGYIIATYNPADYRKVINRKRSKIMLISARIMLIVTLCIGTVLPIPYQPILSSVVVPMGRLSWSVSVCLFVAVAEYGSLRKLTNSLGWRGFVPLSKLTFCLYLIHPFLIQKERLPGRTLGVFSIYLMIKNGCGVTILSCVLSLIFYLIIEAPVVNISNSLLGKKSQQIRNGEISSENRITNNEAKSKLS